MGWVVVGAILIAVGAVFFFVQRNQQNRAFAIRTARSVNTAELAHMASEIAQEIGGGSWREYVKVSGVIECDRPLVSELKQEPCVHYTMSVRREYEETVTVKNDQGDTRTETRRGSETLSTNKQSIPFWLRDAHGQIEVDPNGADIETVRVLDDFRPEQAIGGLLSYGKFSLALGRDTRRTLGYHYSESVLPILRRVLVVGMVSDSNGRLTIQKPTESGKQFIISLKSEDELTRNADQSAKFSLYGMIGCLAIGVVLLLIGLLR